MNNNNHTNPTKINNENNPFNLLAKALHLLKNNKAGAKIQVINGLDCKDRFVTTRTFPLSFTEMRSLFSDYKKWQQIRKAVPHLFQKQKVIYLIQNKINLLTTRIADKIYNNELEKRAIHLEELKELNFFRNRNQDAVIFQEYSFNYQRFYIEALKYFKNKGGQIDFLNDDGNAKNEQKPAVLIPVKTYPKFELVVKEHNSLIRFYEKNENILATPFFGNPSAFSTNELLKIADKYFTIGSAKTKAANIEAPPDLDSIYNTILLIDERLPCSFESSQIDDYYEICLEKFDLAKQTGIGFEDFKTYFHRYGKGIDELTETAYRLLDINRNPEKIWKSAESDFQSKYERNHLET